MTYVSPCNLQKTLPQLAFHELGGCGLLQSFMHNELNSLVELDINKGLFCCNLFYTVNLF